MKPLNPLKFKLSILASATIVLGSFHASAQVTASQIYNGLISYWPMDVVNTNGTIITTPDVAFTNNMSVVALPSGGEVVVPGKFGNAFQFGTSASTTSFYLLNWHSFSNTQSGLPIYGAGAYTVAMWVQGTNGQLTRYIYAEGSTASGNPLLIIQTPSATTGPNPKGLDVSVRTLAGVASLSHVRTTNNVFDGTWHHFAWVDNHGSAVVYVDGKLDPANFNYAYTSGNAATTFNDSTFGCLLRSTATNAGAGFFNGLIDDAAVWARPLSQAEVQYVMTNSIPTPIPQSLPPGLVGAPLSNQTNALGDYIVLSTAAVTTPPIIQGYQWYEDGIALTNATNATFLVPSTNVSSHNFSAIITNAYGAFTNGPATLTIAPDPAPNISSNVVDYWPFDEVDYLATVTNTPDVYFSNNIVLLNMDTNSLVPGQFGNALSFNPAYQGNQFGIRSSSLPLYNLTNYSISMWVNGTPTNSAGTVVNGNTAVYSEGNTNTTTPLFCLLTDAAGSPRLDVLARNDASVSEVAGVLSSNAVFDGTWHHIVWVDLNGKAMLYVDGKLDAANYNYNRVGTTTLNTSTIGAIWRSVTNDYFTGYLDDIAVWTRRLTYTEIQLLQSNTVPLPVAATPPTFTQQPAAPPFSPLYTGDSASFTTLASGTAPLYFQWYQNGQPIPGATTNFLAFNPAQPTNTGSYYEVITNAAGSVTSAVVQLTVLPYTPPTTGTVLAIDFNAVGIPATQPGFEMINLGMSGYTFGSFVKVSIAPIRAAVLADRYRSATTSAPFYITNNPPQMTTAALYNSFIFDDSATLLTGIDVQLQRLAPNTQYGITLWSYDPESSPDRVSDWSEVTSGTQLLPPPASAYPSFPSAYFFDGTNNPVADYDCTFGGLVTSSPTGTLDIQGTQDASSTSFGVFLNAMTLVANPVPQIISVSIAPDGNVQVVAQAQYPGGTLNFYQSPTLGTTAPIGSAGSSWQLATPTITATHGPIVTAEFAPPSAATQMYYRVANY